MVCTQGSFFGLTTSGTRGVRTKISLAIGLINTDPDQSIEDICTNKFEIEVAGLLYPATLLTRPAMIPTTSIPKR